MIEYSPKTEKQLRDKLKQGGKYTDEIIDKAIEFLKKHKYIDDETLARRYIELNKDKYSKTVIFQKLYQKGIKRELIDMLKADESIFYDEESLCEKLLLKKCPDYKDKKDTMDMKERQKIYAYLVRKGISYDTVSRVLKLV
ncbi:MAG: recombination regulator RecX [Lachnospiraceae bacterium]|nr:recombination regulator RecX [Lachnospiraceae bacterium]